MLISIMAPKILFVDNSRTTRAMMSKILASKGYNDVSTAASGIEAIDMVKTGNFDLVIMDLYMPIMDGHTAAAQIRQLEDEKLKNIPIIALSASSDQNDVTISEEAGMNLFVVKSSDYEPLFNAVASFITT